MSSSIHRVWILVLACLAALAVPARAVEPLKAGDRVVIYGDSITEQKLYSRYLQQYVYCRYPDLKVTFHNAGWGGDRAPGALKRLERDVLQLNPTVVTLFFGMNDGNYRKLDDATVSAYRQGMDGLIAALKAKGVRVIVFSPGCVDEDRKKNLADADYNKTLAALGDVGKELAAKHGCEFVDVQAPMAAFQAEQKAKQPDFTMIPDAVHPDAKGHLVMARTMLTAFAEPMAPLGEADLSSTATQGGVEIVSRSDTGVVLKATTGVPFWIDPGSLVIAKDCGMIDFATPRLIVRGLASGHYQITVDGSRVAQASAEQLATGVALPLPSPQGKWLHDLVAVKESNYFTLWRQVRLPLADVPDVASISDDMMEADDALHDAIHKLSATSTPLTIAIDALPGGPNLAMGKPYQCNDPNRYNWGIGGLTDGSWEGNSKNCFASGDGANFPKTVTIDLEQTVAVSNVTLGVPDFGSTRTISVAVSEDGQTFTDVGTHEFAQKTRTVRVFSFTPVTARYVRLTYPDHHDAEAGYNNRFVFTTEVEVYGPSSR